MTLVAGLDLGTSGAKLMVLAADGTPVEEASEPYSTRTLTGGVVEQDPQTWWDAACAVLQRCGLGPDIVAIGLTGQMQDLVAVRGRRELGAALLYSDTRAGRQQRRLADAIVDWEGRTGNLQDLTSVAAKIAVKRAKDHKEFVVKGGFFEGSVLDEAGIEMPMRDTLRAFLVEGRSPQEHRARIREHVSSDNRSWSLKNGPRLALPAGFRWTQTIDAVDDAAPGRYCRDIEAWARAVLQDAETI